MRQQIKFLKSMKIIAKGGPRFAFEIQRGDLISGYMHPQMHMNLKRLERFKKRKLRYE